MGIRRRDRPERVVVARARVWRQGAIAGRSRASGHGGDTAPTLEFAYQAVPLKITNNGHAVVSDEAGSGAKITVKGQAFALAQVHVHTPSEHEIKGVQTELELHFVHKNEKGELAVVGLLAKKGAANPILAPYFANMPTRAMDRRIPPMARRSTAPR